MKILIAGDSHGNAHFIEHLCKVATVNKCELIVQVGDFGLWPGPSGKKFLLKANKLLTDARLELWWLDGNHEDHARIEEWSKRENFYTELQPVTSRIHYMPRGYRFELDGLKFMALGGAWSIDKDMRTPNVSWWPQEELTHADYMRATADADPIDVLLSHDMPARKEAYAYFPFMAEGGDSNRQFVQAVAWQKRALLHVHGHMHKAYKCRFDDGRLLVGLDCDQAPNAAWAILDTEQRTLSTLFAGSMSFKVHGGTA